MAGHRKCGNNIIQRIKISFFVEGFCLEEMMFILFPVLYSLLILAVWIIGKRTHKEKAANRIVLFMWCIPLLAVTAMVHACYGIASILFLSGMLCFTGILLVIYSGIYKMRYKKPHTQVMYFYAAMFLFAVILLILFGVILGFSL